VISTLVRQVSAWVIATNEEAMIAPHAARLLEV